MASKTENYENAQIHNLPLGQRKSRHKKSSESCQKRTRSIIRKKTKINPPSLHEDPEQNPDSGTEQKLSSIAKPENDKHSKVGFGMIANNSRNNNNNRSELLNISNNLVLKKPCYFDNCFIKDALGQVVMTCKDKCNVRFHRQCWKKKTSLESQRQKSLHELLGDICPTPDCGSKICRLVILGHDGSIKHEYGMEVKPDTENTNLRCETNIMKPDVQVSQKCPVWLADTNASQLRRRVVKLISKAEEISSSRNEDNISDLNTRKVETTTMVKQMNSGLEVISQSAAPLTSKNTGAISKYSGHTVTPASEARNIFSEPIGAHLPCSAVTNQETVLVENHGARKILNAKQNQNACGRIPTCGTL